MTTDLLDQAPAHPLACLIEGLGRLLEEHADGPAWTLSTAQLTGLLPELARLKRRLDAVELRLLREGDRHQIGDPLGAANTAGWWANATRITKPAAHQAVALAERLDEDNHDATAAAMGTGGVSVEQARVILDAVDALPAELVGPVLRRDAEAHLVGLAEHHDPKDLRVLGRRVLEVLAPDVAEEHERRVLEDEERHAAATATFAMRPDGHGSMRGRFKIPVLAGEMLAKHLAALAAPKHRTAGGSPGFETGPDGPPQPPDPWHSVGSPGFETGPDGPPQPPVARVSRQLRLGAAFIEYVETRPKTDTPKAGGLAATVVVTMTMEALLGADQVATLDTGSRISAGEARRIACGAGIIPAVLGGTSQVLDLGRKTRFHTEPQRIALAHRDRGCAAEGCDWPPGLCHAHHPKPWSKGGGTSVQNGQLLCPRHHTLAHDARYQLKSDSSGRVTFSRRT